MDSEPQLTRRDFLRRARRAGIGCVAAGAGSGVYGGLIEPTWFEVVRRDIILPRLPDAFAGFTIAQISDLHFSSFVKPKDVAPAIQSVLALDADAIVVTGDLVTRVTHGETDMIVQALSPLRAREGVFAVLGNHDWWEGASQVTTALERAGITMLSNRHIGWQRGGQTLYLAGVDDIWCRKHDLEAALRGLPATAAAVLLAHEPDYADEVARDGRVLLQLSGHTHGGQVCLPFIGGLRFPPLGRKYTAGLYEVGGLKLYTNRGLGMVGVPFRFWCRPEVTLLTLRAG